MKRYSIWKEHVKMRSYESLDRDLDIDVLIIGGGLTGISTLYHLGRSNLRVALVEQNKIGMGVTSNSTGKLTFLQDNIYHKLLSNFDFDTASMYLKSQREAIQLAVDIIENNKIDCELEKTNSYVYTNQEQDMDKLDELKNFLKSNDISVLEDWEGEGVVESCGVVGVTDTYLFHPVKFIYGLLGHVSFQNIYENTSIKKIEKEGDGYSCYTDEFVIRTKWVVVASHYPYFSLPFLFPIKGNLEKSYLSASRKKLGKSISLISYDTPFISARTYLDYLIYLSNSHNVSSQIGGKDHFEELVKKITELGLEPEYLWSNMDIMTNDGLPYVGEIDDKIVLATGYNTWGMTNGILAGKMVSDLIGGIDNCYLSLFDPKRKNSSMLIESVIDGYYSASGLVKGFFSKSEQVEYKRVEGKEVAVYRDEKGDHVVYTKCPHMGCRLIFNEVEKTWDCPCHASRFDVDGKCISGPANQDISCTIDDE